MLIYRTTGWWYWLVTVIALTAGVAGCTPGLYIAIALTAVHLIHFTIRERSVTAFPVQVRIAYLAYLVVALREPPPLPLLAAYDRHMDEDPYELVLSRKIYLGYAMEPEGNSNHIAYKRTFLSPPVRVSILQALEEDKASEEHI